MRYEKKRSISKILRWLISFFVVLTVVSSGLYIIIEILKDNINVEIDPSNNCLKHNSGTSILVLDRSDPIDSGLASEIISKTVDAMGGVQFGYRINIVAFDGSGVIRGLSGMFRLCRPMNDAEVELKNREASKLDQVNVEIERRKMTKFQNEFRNKLIEIYKMENINADTTPLLEVIGDVVGNGDSGGGVVIVSDLMQNSSTLEFPKIRSESEYLNIKNFISKMPRKASLIDGELNIVFFRRNQNRTEAAWCLDIERTRELWNILFRNLFLSSPKFHVVNRNFKNFCMLRAERRAK